jgi:hypothetical protein
MFTNNVVHLKQWFLIGAMGVCFVGLATVPAQAVILSLNPTLDLDVNSTGSVSDTAFLNINGNNSGSNQRRALLKFDLTNPQLIGATINSATLTLNQNELGSLDQFGAATLRRIGTQNWTGVTSGTTLFTIANDANAVAIASFSPATSPPPGLYPINVTSTVQDWVNGTFANFGFGINATEGPFSGVQRQFDSVSGSIAPVLLIDFTVQPAPEPSSLLLLGLGALALTRRTHRARAKA